MRVTEDVRRQWIELLRGGSYRPTIGPAEAGTTLLAYLLQSPLDVTATYHVEGDDATAEPIPALLPRDWPRRIERLCESFGVQHPSPAVTAALALVDGWVLAVNTTLEPTRVTLPDDWERRVNDVVTAQPRGAAGVAEAVRGLIASWVPRVDRNHDTGDVDG